MTWWRRKRQAGIERWLSDDAALVADIRAAWLRDEFDIAELERRVEARLAGWEVTDRGVQAITYPLPAGGRVFEFSGVPVALPTPVVPGPAVPRSFALEAWRLATVFGIPNPLIGERNIREEGSRDGLDRVHVQGE